MTGPTVLHGLDEVRASVGRALGASDWVEITPERLERYAAAAGNGEAAWLLLSLTNLFLPQILAVEGVSAGVNYGTDAVSFPAPVPVGARVRGTAEVLAATDVAGGVQTTIRITVEVEGRAEPAVVVDSLSRWVA
jgi:acyl dehydratase